MNEAEASPKRSLVSRILINAMSGAGSRVATMGLGFLLTPFIISELGLTEYGLLAVVGSLAGYLGLLDFGLGGAFVKFISEFLERDDKVSARQVVIFVVLFYAAFGLILAAPVLFLAPYIVHAFKMAPAQYAPAATLLRVFFGLLVLSMLGSVPGMVVVSMQRMDLASRNGFLGYVVYAAVTLVFLKLHYGIWAVVVGQVAQLVAASGMQLFTAYRLFGSMWHNPLRIERAIVKRLFSFGGWTQLNSIFSIIHLDVGRFIAAGLVSVTSVGLYEIASKLAWFSRTFPAYLLDAMMPAAARAEARRDENSLDRMYGAGTRLVVFATFALAGLTVGASDPIVRVWLGRSYPFVSDIVFWLALGYAVNSVAGIGTTILRAAGKPRYETYYTGVAVLANVACTIPLVRSFGIVGVAMGTTAGWIVGTVYFLFIYHRVRRSNWWIPIGSPFVRLAFSDLAATAALRYLVHLPLVARCFENRFLGLAVLGIAAIAYVAAFAGLSYATGVWIHDRELIAGRFRELRSGFERRFRAPVYGSHS